MEILKSSEERMGTFNEYVPSNPHETVINLDKVADRARQYANMPTSFTNEKGQSATEAYNEFLDREVDELIARYPPSLAKGEHLSLVIKYENFISWNPEALKIFIRSGNAYFNPFIKLKRSLGEGILTWAKKDYKNMDSLQFKEAVDQALTEFAYQYYKDKENNDKS